MSAGGQQTGLAGWPCSLRRKVIILKLRFDTEQTLMISLMDFIFEFILLLQEFPTGYKEGVDLSSVHILRRQGVSETSAILASTFRLTTSFAGPILFPTLQSPRITVRSAERLSVSLTFGMRAVELPTLCN